MNPKGTYIRRPKNTSRRGLWVGHLDGDFTEPIEIQYFDRHNNQSSYLVKDPIGFISDLKNERFTKYTIDSDHKNHKYNIILDPHMKNGLNRIRIKNTEIISIIRAIQKETNLKNGATIC